MKPIDIVLVIVILAVLFLVSLYIYRAKKKGTKCIGCPDSCACSGGNCTGGCNGCNQGK